MGRLSEWITSILEAPVKAFMWLIVVLAIGLATPRLGPPVFNWLRQLPQTTLDIIGNAILVGTLLVLYMQVRALRRATDTEVLFRMLEIWLRDQQANVPEFIKLSGFTGPNSRYAYLKAHPNVRRRIIALASFLEISSLLSIEGRIPAVLLDKSIGDIARPFNKELGAPLDELVEGFKSLKEFCAWSERRWRIETQLQRIFSRQNVPSRR